jgi:hypothetical protein
MSNPAYGVWLACDQQVMSYLLKSMNQDVVAQVIGLEHSFDVHATIEDLFSSQSKALVSMLCSALQTPRRMTCPPPNTLRR